MRLLLAGVLAGAVLVLAPGPAYACSCVGDDLATHVRQADSIGAGTVAWVATNAGTTTFAADFTEVYKGRLGSREKVRTASDEGSCGFKVVKGTRYLLFLRGSHGGTLRTDICSGSTAYSAESARQLEPLARGGELVEVDQSTITPRKDWFPPWVLWTGAGLAVLVLAGAATIAMKRD